MRTFTCKCGKVSQETKQHIVTTDCCGVGYSKHIDEATHRNVRKPKAGGGKISKRLPTETGVVQ
jgi:hypothetical protein